MGGSQAKPAEVTQAPVHTLKSGEFVDWSGRVVDGASEPMDPRHLNDISSDDPLEGIDFQMIPYRVLESLRKKVEKGSLDACKMLREEGATCLRQMTQHGGACKPLLREYYKCMAGWRDDNDQMYYQLVKDTLEGKLLEKHRRKMAMLENEWKRKFPDMPMPRAHVPGRSRDEESSYYLHELDKDLVTRDLAIQRLAEIDAEAQNLSTEEYNLLPAIGDNVHASKQWQLAF